MAKFHDFITGEDVDHDFGRKRNAQEPEAPKVVTPPGPLNGYCLQNGHTYIAGVCVRCPATVRVKTTATPLLPTTDTTERN